MLWKVVLKGDNPSGRILAVLYARTGETIDSAREMLASSGGMLVQAGLAKNNAETLVSELPNDGSVEVLMLRDEGVCVPVLIGYRPGSRGRLRIALQKLSGLSTEKVIRFLSSIPIILKSDADRTTAESIQKILGRSGGIVEIRSPEDLIGIASRKQYSPVTSPKKRSIDSSENEAISSLSENSPSLSSPPSIDAGKANLDKPSLINFNPPSLNEDSSPPVLDTWELENPVYKEPYIIRFTVPASSIPRAIPVLQEEFTVPDYNESASIVLIYLFPVATDDRDRVERILCESLDISPERAEEIISEAPTPLAGFCERIDALITLSELSEKGIPVSLIRESADQIQLPARKSLLSWLNGLGHTS